MSDVAQSDDWWQAVDGKWYPPERHPNYVRPEEAPPLSAPSEPSTSSEPLRADASPQPTHQQHWVVTAESALTHAVATNTPESWQEAAEASLTASQMAKVMMLAAEARQTADEKVQAAGVAEHNSIAAKEAAEQSAIAAEEAIKAKVRAEQAACDAQSAEQTAHDEATQAKERSRGLQEVAAWAMSANTPSAWSEALERASNGAGPADE